MKVWRAITLSACLPWAASAALAQDAVPTAYPNLLPLPAVTAPAGYYPLAAAQVAPSRGYVTPTANYSMSSPETVPTPDAVSAHANNGGYENNDPQGIWADQGAGGCSTCNNGGGYGDVGYEGDFGGYGGCGGSCGSPWFGSVYGLVMSRDGGNKYWTSYETNNNPNQLMHTQDADSDWAGGAGFTIGHYCGCNHGIEFGYWALGEMSGSAGLRDINNNLSTPIDLQDSMLAGDPTAFYFDNAREHRISRESNFQNLEVNFLTLPMNQCGCGLQVTWLAGFRWFQFDENLLFSSVSFGNEFGSAGGANEAHLAVDVENNLYGVQVGARANWFLGRRFSLFATPKFGVYANDMEVRSSLYRGDGVVGFDISGSDTDVAILGSLDLGASYYITPQLSVFGGYRVLGVSGVALTDNQIPHYMAAADEFADVDRNGSLILHGAFAGVQYNY